MGFYTGMVALGVATATAAVLWNRWYIRYLIRKEYKRQLNIERGLFHEEPGS